MANFKQGHDLILEVQVLNEQNQKVTLTGAEKIRVALIVKKVTIQKYLDSTLESVISGYGEVSINATDATKLDIQITREQSKLFPIGELSVTILVEFPDAILDGIATEYTYVVGNILKGYLKDEDLSV